MSFLLDTHALLWWLFNDPKLSATARAILSDPNNVVFVSSASAWEITTKYRLGKLESAAVLVQDVARFVVEAGFEELPIGIAHAQQAGLWSHAHRDPFDRMLAAQAKLDDLTLLSLDPELRQFGVRIVW
jgi:PIN domain nuclease of toxin-antitoxin system